MQFDVFNPPPPPPLPHFLLYSADIRQPLCYTHEKQSKNDKVIEILISVAEEDKSEPLKKPPTLSWPLWIFFF